MSTGEIRRTQAEVAAMALQSPALRFMPHEALAPVTAEPEAIAAHIRHAASRGAVVVAGDLIALAATAAIIVPHLVQWWVLLFGLSVLVISAWRGSYRTAITMTVAGDVGSVMASVGIPLVILALVYSLQNQDRTVLELGLGAFGAILLLRAVSYGLIRRFRRAGSFGERTLIVGAGQVAVHFATTLDEHPEYGLRPVGFLDDIEGEELSHPVLGRVADMDRVLHDHQIDRVVMAFGVGRETALVDVLRACDSNAVDIHVLPRFFELGFGGEGANVDVVWGYPLLRLRRDSTRLSRRIAKRMLDIAFAGLMLLVCSPIYATLALAVKFTSRGPVYFRQNRVGKDGRPVTILKFRSMRVNDDSDTKWDVSADTKVTAIGGLMRKTSLDELPQLWNVVRGDMSLVGPRPERPFFVEQFKTEVPHYQDRHRVAVGLTGLAQVNGLRGDTSIEDRAWFDNHYIDNWSMRHDLIILARTLVAVVRQARKSGS
jgi:exopolysaccharide biosynthesis polyprenyl glycosylphosphotransferase